MKYIAQFAKPSFFLTKKAAAFMGEHRILEFRDRTMNGINAMVSSEG